MMPARVLPVIEPSQPAPRRAVYATGDACYDRWRWTALFSGVFFQFGSLRPPPKNDLEGTENFWWVKYFMAWAWNENSWKKKRKILGKDGLRNPSSQKSFQTKSNCWASIVACASRAIVHSVKNEIPGTWCDITSVVLAHAPTFEHDQCSRI